MGFIIENGVLIKCVKEHGVTEVTIPDSVTEIGKRAFEDCESLKKITIPSSVTQISDEAFCDCSSLTKVTIPSSVTEIGEGAFYGCESLTEINIPSSVTQIGVEAFYNCSSLKKITISSSVTQSGKRAFKNCGKLKKIYLESGNTSLLDDSELKGIAVKTFFDEPEKFNETAKKNIAAYISKQKKKYLPIILKKDNAEFLSVLADNGTINKTNIEEIFLEPARKAEATQCIAYLLDWKNKNVKKKDIEKATERELTKDPFNATDMKKLWNYEVTEDDTVIIRYYKGSEKDVVIPCRIGKRKVTAIDKDAFSPYRERISDEQEENLRKITSVIIPDPVTQIGDLAFYGCESLTEITIPSSVTQIGEEAFWDCYKLCKITVDENNPVYDSRDDCNAIIKTQTNTLVCGFNTTIIPSSVTQIGDYAFDFCKSLTKITIPSSVTQIGEWAFDGCSSLTEINIPSSVTKIGDNAFAYCSSLPKITIPESVTQIGKDAFGNCRKLKKLYLENGNTSLLDNSGLKEIAVKTFFNEPEKFNETAKKNIAAYISKQKKKYLPIILKKDNAEFLSVLADNGAINKTNIEEIFLEPARKAEATQCIAYLLDWKNKNIKQEDIGKATERELTKDPFNVTDMKKLWGYAVTEEDTVIIRYYKGSEKNVIIPLRIGNRTVTAIEEYAFSPYRKRIPDEQKENLRKITSVIIPDSVTQISSRAFRCCRSLKEITIPASVTEIGNWAFDDCKSLTEITIPSSVTQIGDWAFNGCDATIKCYPGSIAEEYAMKNNKKYELISE